MIKWLNISLYTDLTKYDNTRKAKNELINQGVETVNVQY